MKDHEKGRPSGLPFSLGAVLLILGGFVVYLPGIDGPFLFDDFPNIVQDRFVAIDAIDVERFADIAFPEGQFRRRPLARATFALNYYFAGQSFDELAFKLTNVLIHLLNGLLVYTLCSLLCRRQIENSDSNNNVRASATRLVPLIAGIVWTLHPIQLTSVLYVVQRMTSLSALFVLAGLVLFVLGRSRLERAQPLAMTLLTTGVIGGTVLGALCKETAVLAPSLALVVELFFFDRRRLSDINRKRLKLFYLTSVFGPGLLALGLLFGKPEITAAMFYSIRDFTLIERVLTESRILFFYVGLVFFPNVRNFGLFHDDIPLSTSLVDPWTTSVSLIGWLILVLLAFSTVRRRSMWGFAIAWFLVGHAVESSFLALEPVHEHRNYLPSFGLVLVTVHYLVGFLTRSTSMRRLVVPIAVLLVLSIGFSTWTRATFWRDMLTLTTLMERNHPRSYRTQMAVGLALAQTGQDLRLVYEAFRSGAAINSKAVAPLIEMAKLVNVPLITGTISSSPLGDGEGISLKDEFSTNREWLIGVQLLLEQEIARRLKQYPIVPTTTLTLLSLADCTRTQTAVCVALAPNNLNWHRIALENPRIRPDERTLLGYSSDALGKWLDQN